MTQTLPAGACDTHLHFYSGDYDVAAAAILRPPPATPSDYRELQTHLGLERLVVVQPTTYGLDNRCQLDAMEAFGPDARGVMVVSDKTTSAELADLTERGVTGARFHMLPGGAVPWEMLETVATNVEPFGWHIQLQLNGRELHQRRDLLLALPVDIVVDHIGRFMPPVSPDHPSFRTLVDLLDVGRAWVKLSAPYESSQTGPPDYTDTKVLAETLVKRVPERILWASNWPHPGQTNPPPFEGLRQLMETWLPTPELLHRVLVDNPAELYGY